MRILAMRHAPSSANAAGRIAGHRDVELLQGNEQQIEAACQLLSQFDLDRIISSDLTRAMQTAEHVGKTLDLPTHTDPALREMDYGELTGMRKSAAARKFSGYKHDSNFSHAGGESQRQVLNRVLAFIDTTTLDCTLLVTHAGVLRVLYAHHAGMPLSEAASLPVENCAILRIEDGIVEWLS